MAQNISPMEFLEGDLMAGVAVTNLSDYDRLKEINTELSDISHKRKACRLKTSLFGAFGGIILAASSIALFHNLLNSNNDWARNTNSPIHQEVTNDLSGFMIPIPLSIAGYLLGFGLFYLAKTNCAMREQLCDQEWSLMSEMRKLRDKMYPHDIDKRNRKYAPPKPEYDHPLNPDEARGEYVGVYSPPGSHKEVANR
jgi:hypothetical protein